MQIEARISPVNSIVFISDIDGGKTPLPEWGEKVAATPSCVVLAVYPEQDGPTTVIMCDAPDVLPEAYQIFDGSIDTPHGVLMVSTVDDIHVLEMKVRGRQVRVRAWVNDLQWPSRVVIGVG